MIDDTKTFSLKIETIVRDLHIPYMEEIVHYCEQNDIEVETAAKLINVRIKQTIAGEASDLNMMKEKINKLPI